eukprot:scaffold3841_cov122-Cylindrotheca_fusiformis.AAC.2
MVGAQSAGEPSGDSVNFELFGLHPVGQQLQVEKGSGKASHSLSQSGRRSASSISKQLSGHCSRSLLQLVGTGDGAGVGTTLGRGDGSIVGAQWAGEPSGESVNIGLSGLHSDGQQLHVEGSGSISHSSLHLGRRSFASVSKQLSGHCSMRSLQLVGTGDGGVVGTTLVNIGLFGLHSVGQQLQVEKGRGKESQSSSQSGRRSVSSISKQLSGHCSRSLLQLVGTGDGARVGTTLGRGDGSIVGAQSAGEPSGESVNIGLFGLHSDGQQLHVEGSGSTSHSLLQLGRRSFASSSKQLSGHCSMRSLQFVGSGDGGIVGTTLGWGEGNIVGAQSAGEPSGESVNIGLFGLQSVGQQLHVEEGRGRASHSSPQLGRRSVSSISKQLSGQCSRSLLQLVGLGDGAGVGTTLGCGDGNIVGAQSAGEPSGESVNIGLFGLHSDGQQLHVEGSGSTSHSLLQLGRRSFASSSKQLSGHCSMRSLQLVGTGDGGVVGTTLG